MKDQIHLPPPQLRGEISLEEALAQRRSVRELSSRPMTDQELSQLLWAAQGITSPEGYRTAPSAGGLLAMEVYVAGSQGFFHYEPRGHRLLPSSERDPRTALYHAALQQDALAAAPAVLVLTAVFERIARKYGTKRSPRYVHMEAGHVAQNVLLEAVALGLGAVVIGSFDDAQVHAALALPKDHQPLYLIPVGEPS